MELKPRSSSWLRRVQMGRTQLLIVEQLLVQSSAQLLYHSEMRMIFSNMQCHFEQVIYLLSGFFLVRVEKTYCKIQDYNASLCVNIKIFLQCNAENCSGCKRGKATLISCSQYARCQAKPLLCASTHFVFTQSMKVSPCYYPMQQLRNLKLCCRGC